MGKCPPERGGGCGFGAGFGGGWQEEDAGGYFFPPFLTLLFNYKPPTDLASPIPAGCN